MERYEEEDGRYVLYPGGVRFAASDSVALLIDADSGKLITHGEPHSVRRGFDSTAPCRETGHP